MEKDKNQELEKILSELNSNIIAEMITTQRGYQANTRIITVTDQMLEELVMLATTIKNAKTALRR